MKLMKRLLPLLLVLALSLTACAKKQGGSRTLQRRPRSTPPPIPTLSRPPGTAR